MVTAFRRAAGVATVVLATTATPSWAEEPAETLRLSRTTAVPGQVLVLRGAGIGGRQARVTIAGRTARIVQRTATSVWVVVPRLPPGKATVRARRPGGFLTARLRIDRGYGGAARPRIDAARARSGTLGRLGGTVTATGADGTVYALRIPPGALATDTAVTLTPLRTIAGLPVTGPAIGVQFGPDGLVLLEPATLTITRKGAVARTTVGYVYVGNGRDVELERARRSGSTLSIEIEHFSGAGAGQITVAGFLTYVARLLTGQLTLADVDQFLHELGVVQAIFGEFCLSEATCTELVRRSIELLEREAAKIRCGSRDVGDNLAMLRDGLFAERDLRLVGKDAEPNRIANERRCITNSLVTAAVGPAQSDALGSSSQAATVSQADRALADFDRENGVSNGEWAGFLGGIAAAQGFADHQARAFGALETGLGTVLADGKALCDQTLDDGKALLERGKKLADATAILDADFAAAIEACVPKVFVTPAAASVEVGQTKAFAARSNQGDTTFDWTATDGSVDGAGLVTAPTKPGSVTVTATVRRIVKGTATVTVTCPAGQVEFMGECRTITVSVTPASATIAPNGSQQFTATVANATDQAVTWTASGGSIGAGGLFSAPSQPGSYTITARSVADPTKTGTAALTVAQPGVLVIARSSSITLDASVIARGTSPSCPAGFPQTFAHDAASRQGIPSPLGLWDPSPLGAGVEAMPVGCNGGITDAEADVVAISVQQDVRSTSGDLVASVHQSVSHALTTTLTAAGLTNLARTTVHGVLAVSFDVIGVPVTLSCSTTLSGDSRAGSMFENEDSVFELHLATGTGAQVLHIEDTTAPTTVVLQPGRYGLSIEDKTSRLRTDSNLGDEIFIFVADGECHRTA